jgi:SAM-dependent methyltransferase
MSILPCPICNGLSTEMLLSLDCGNLDGSKLYPTVRLIACTSCGHVYNDLLPDEISGLDEYYNNEYAPANLNSIVKEGDLPGSTSKYTHDRYDQLYQMLSPHMQSGDSVLDVGCAVGGFLDFLKEKRFTNLYGVDMTEAYVERARRKKYNIQIGSAESLPFGNNLFDALVIEQVLEHIVNPVVAFREAGRVLKQGGVLCIGVPNAARYSDLYYFDFYWLLMREHIQHFDIHSLTHLAVVEGFELLGHQQTSHPIMGDKMVMPNLSAMFRYKGPGFIGNKIARPKILLSEKLNDYVGNELSRLSEKKDRIDRLANSQRPVYAWGIGREFLYLYEAAGLKNCNLAEIIDMNPFKQRTAMVSGRKVSTPDALVEAGTNAVLLITAIAHESAIRKCAIEQLYQGEFFSMV